MDRGKTISRYRILDRIAEGGMGEVYRAKMETLGGAEKVVALKVVRKDLAENNEFASLFIDEARLAIGLSHVNIVQSFDAGRIDNQLFLAMEYVAGFHMGDLLEACERCLGQNIPRRHLLYIMVEALKGLDYAHRRVDSAERSLGIVHRDVSPGNILISLEGEVKVADFGIAKSTLRSRRTTSGRVKGKIPYIAPEQLRESGVDPRTDIYSLGAVMYEALTGHWLVDPNDAERAIQDVLQGRFASPRELRSDVPQALEAIVLRALDSDPRRRYATAPAMRQELERYALSEGYLLSSADLSDFLETLRTEPASAPTSDDLTSAPTDRTIDPGASAPPNGPFNALLGAELQRLETADPFSVFTTEEVPNGRSAKDLLSGALPPTRPRPRWQWLALLLGTIAVAIVLGRWVTDEAPPSAVPVEDNATQLLNVDPGPAESAAPVPALPIAETAPAQIEPERAEPTTVPPAERKARGRAKKRKASASTGEPAFVSVNSDPWSYVVIDGERIRATPLRSHRITPGKHEVILRNPDAGLERRFEIDVQPGESKRLSIDLRESQ